MAKLAQRKIEYYARWLCIAGNMTAVKAQGEVFATEARSLFNQGGFRGSTFSCPGSLVLWGPTINVNRDVSKRPVLYAF